MRKRWSTALAKRAEAAGTNPIDVATAATPEQLPAVPQAGSQKSHEQLCTSIRAYCTVVLRWPCYRTDAAPVKKADGSYATPRAEPGLTDLLVILPDGVTAYIEVKTGRARLNPNQQRFRSEVISRGAPYYVARSLDLFIRRAAEWAREHKRRP